MADATSSKKILIVEDNDVLSEIYYRRIQSEGFDAKLVTNGTDAAKTAAEFKPDLILLDLMLPGVNGLNVLDEIRKAPETKDTKVYVFSALGQTADKERAMELGATKYLIKSKDVLADIMVQIKAELGVA